MIGVVGICGRGEAPEALFPPLLVLIDVEGDGTADMVHDNDPKTAPWIVAQTSTTLIALSLWWIRRCLPGAATTRLERRRHSCQLGIAGVLKGDKSRLNRLKLRIEDPPRRPGNMVFLGASVLGDIHARP